MWSYEYRSIGEIWVGNEKARTSKSTASSFITLALSQKCRRLLRRLAWRRFEKRDKA